MYWHQMFVQIMKHNPLNTIALIVIMSVVPTVWFKLTKNIKQFYKRKEWVNELLIQTNCMIKKVLNSFLSAKLKKK